MAMWSDDERDDRIDRAIDEVARRMTEGAPGAAFKGRVLARLFDHSRPDGLHRSPHVRWRLAWIASPLAAAAIILLIIFARSNSGRDHHQVETPPAPPVVARAPVEPPTPRPQENTPPARANITRPHDTRTSVVPPSALDALAPPPLAVDSIALGEIEPVESIGIPRLETITPIALAPIDEGDRP
jgi:hypothetical protein